jgi:hypothetical protein
MSEDGSATELVKAAAEGASSGALAALISPVSGFLGKLLGQPAEELGGWAADAISFRRWQSRVKMLARASEILSETGMDAEEVPLRLLMPILDKGANEDRSEMEERWASLLANAASADEQVPVAFPEILSQLEPEQAQILDHVYDVMMSIAPEARKHNLGMIQAGIANDLALDPGVIEYHVDNLFRLRLVREPTGTLGGEGDTVTLSAFGRKFVRACRSPSQPDPPIIFTDAAEVQRQATLNRQRRSNS